MRANALVFARRFDRSGGVRVLVGEGGMLAAVGNDRLAEPHAGFAELCELLGAQFRMALRHEAQGFVHPLRLVFPLCAEHAALADGAEEFVAGPVQG